MNEKQIPTIKIPEEFVKAANQSVKYREALIAARDEINKLAGPYDFDLAEIVAMIEEALTG